MSQRLKAAGPSFLSRRFRSLARRTVKQFAAPAVTATGNGRGFFPVRFRHLGGEASFSPLGLG